MSDLACDNCGVRHGSDDIFCENCGYDFITGSMPPEGGDGPGLDEAFPPMLPDEPPPEQEQPKPAAPAVPSAPEVFEAVRVRFEVAVDRPYFDSVVSEGELDFPDPAPEAKEMEVAGTELHIGRTSESRAIHPDLDIAQLTGDPAVSSRHAVVRAAPDGTVTVTDVGSTNGTFVGAVDAEAIAVGDPVAVTPGTPVYLGAWTRLAISTA